MKNNLLAKYLLTIIIVFIFSCKKTTTDNPVITISSPYAGQIFNIGDVMNVKAVITFNTTPQFVKMTLINSNYISVDVTQSLTVTGSPMNINTTYTFNNATLPTGTYYLEITAGNGSNIVNSYQPITLKGIPVKRKAIYMVTGSNNANTKVWKIDSTNTITPVISLTGDFANAAINSTDQCMYTCGIYSGNFNCINLRTNTLSWYEAANNTGFPTFESVYSNNHWNLLAGYYNTITGYNSSQQMTLTSNTLTGTFPHTMYSDANYLFAEQRSYTGSSVNLKLYHIANGIAYQEAVLNEDIVAMFSVSSDSLLVLSNNNGVGHASIYRISSNSFVTAHTLPAEKIFSASQISPILYLIGMQSKIYLLNIGGNAAVNTFANVSAAPAIKYDTLNQQIFVASAMNLNIYNFPADTLVSTFLFSDTLRDISILNNK